MRTAILLIVLIILVAIGGFLIFFNGDMAPALDFANDTSTDQTTDDDSFTSGPNNNGNTGNNSNDDQIDDNTIGSNDDLQDDESTTTDSDTNTTGNNNDNVTQLPNTAIISDEADMIIMGLILILTSAYLLKSGMLYRFALNTGQKVFGLDLTSFDYENANWVQKNIYRKMTER